MTDPREHREGSILVRIDGRLDAVDSEAPLWNNLRAHINGSMAEFPHTPVYIDLRKVMYADPRCVVLLDEVLEETRQHVPVIFLGPGPGLEAMYAVTGDFILEPLRMFAPWEEEELAGLPGIDEPDDSTLGPKVTRDGEIASALSEVLTDAEEEDQYIPAYEEPACFQPAAPPSLLRAEEDDEQDVFEINLDIEKAHLESGMDGHDDSSRDTAIRLQRTPWRSTVISTGSSNAGSNVIPDPGGSDAGPDGELLQTLARLEKRNRELEAKQREQEARLRAEHKELDYQRSLTQQERQRVEAEVRDRQARLEEEEARAREELAAREAEVEEARIRAAQAAVARQSEIESQLSTQRDVLERESADLERARAIESGKQAHSREEIERERARIDALAEQQQQEITTKKEAVEASLERQRAAIDHDRNTLEEEAARTREVLNACEEDLARREMQFQVEVPSSAANWLEWARVGTAEGVVLREEFLALIERFTTQGFVDPEEVGAFVKQVDSLAAGIAANLSRLLPRCGEASRDAHWGGLLLMTSTLAREEKSAEQRRVALTAALLGTLVQHAPGCQPQSGEVGHDIEAHVMRLLESGFCELETGFVAETVRQDLAVWRAGLRICSADTISPHTWGRALSAMLGNLDPTDPACQGLPRILSTHSVFMPGSWIELSSGVFGQVVGAADGKPERPTVLVMFEFDGTRARPISPRLFPQPDEDDVQVKRVLDESEFVSLGTG